MKRLLLILAYAAAALLAAGVAGYLVVAFMVEKAPEVEVPSVTGLTLGEALDVLTERKLDLEVRDFVFSDEVEENRVTLQRPQAGQVVRAGRSVGVVVSRGAERHPVPDLVGMRAEDAAIQLAEKGLKSEIGARIKFGPEGTVIGQSRAAGSRLLAGEKVALLVSSGPRPLLYRMPRLEGMGRAEAETQLTKLGLKAERVEMVNLGDISKEGKIASQDPLPGFPVSLETPIMISVVGPRP